MNPFDQQQPVPGIKHIIAVGSGKGGVGKSTIASNLAVQLKKQGRKVGLLDADVYGPSVPRLFGALNQPPAVQESGKIEPVLRHGLKLMSMGFLVDESSALVWRGPMLFKVMDQFFRDVNWGELDYLIVDLPPGTGDVALTLAQKVPVSGAIVACTPQNLALIDARKAIDMFNQVNIPVLGIVENMSYLRGKDGEETQLFPKGDLDAYLDANKMKKLGSIPFQPNMGLAGEAGIPYVMSEPSSEESGVFTELCEKLEAELG